MTRLRVTFNEVRNTSVDFAACTKAMHNTLFDMTTVDSALAGIADQVLSKLTPSHEQMLVLDRTLMSENAWHFSDGSRCELTSDEGLLRYGTLLVKLQRECNRVLARRKSSA